MILPHTNTLVLVVMLLSLVCLGSWANLYKLAGKWRYELFYFDFAAGLVLTCLLFAFTLGSLGFDGFSFVDDMLNAGKRQWMYGFIAAIIFNFGKICWSPPFPLPGWPWRSLWPTGWLSSSRRPGLLRFRRRRIERLRAARRMRAHGNLFCPHGAGVFAPERLASRSRPLEPVKAASTRRPSSAKAIVLSVVSGILLGVFSPLLNRAQDPDIGVGPYAMAAIFGMGVAFSAIVFNLFLMNLPVEGEPLVFVDYFHSSLNKHYLGLVAGVIFACGLVAGFVCTSPKADTHLSAPTSGLLALSVPLLAALWGLLVWREFSKGGLRAHLFAVLALLLLAGGIAAFSVAPLFAAK